MTDKVYFAASGGRIKIGVSRNVVGRLQDISAHLAEPLHLLGAADGSLAMEREIHCQLAAFRAKGEWFKDCPEVRAAIGDFVARRSRDWIFVNSRLLSLDDKAKPQDSEVTALLNKARSRWPRNTARQLSQALGVSLRTVKYWLSGARDPRGRTLIALQNEFGGAAQ
jgi:hypothetical protein